MARTKKRPLAKAQKHPYKKPSTKSQETSRIRIAKSSKFKPQNCIQVRPTVPFSPSHQILLAGEGDFSFAASLLTHHHCTHLTATSLDPLPTLLSKYPTAASHLATLTSAAQTILHSIDATRLSPSLGHPSQSKPLRQNAPYDRIIFNFPHTGGLTKDVNRQVRANQELLVKFFGSALGVLNEDGMIMVSLFEGEAYGDWNVKDLARSVGMRCVRSERFRWEGFPGYAHVRTLGVVEKGWRGEERSARWYAFRRRGEMEETDGIGMKRRKAKSNDEDEDEDEADDTMEPF